MCLFRTAFFLSHSAVFSFCLYLKQRSSAHTGLVSVISFFIESYLTCKHRPSLSHCRTEWNALISRNFEKFRPFISFSWLLFLRKENAVDKIRSKSEFICNCFIIFSKFSFNKRIWFTLYDDRHTWYIYMCVCKCVYNTCIHSKTDERLRICHEFWGYFHLSHGIFFFLLMVKCMLSWTIDYELRFSIRISL